MWLPPALAPSPEVASTAAATTASSRRAEDAGARSLGPAGGLAVEFDRVIPPSGNMFLAGRQIWLGPARAGLTVRFWADYDLIHLLIGGARVKTLRSHLSVNDLALGRPQQERLQPAHHRYPHPNPFQ